MSGGGKLGHAGLGAGLVAGPVVVRGMGEVVRHDGVVDEFEIEARFVVDLSRVAELDSELRSRCQQRASAVGQ